MNVFDKSEWIWRKGERGEDTYADFVDSFCADKTKKQILRISADSNYTAYVNGRLAAFGQYADYPTYKIYDEVDISEFTVEGKNRLAIVVWYYGRNSQTYYMGDAGLIFEVDEDGERLCFSNEKTLSRPSRDYIQGRGENISPQLGFTYHYDARGYDGFIEDGADGFSESVTVDTVSRDFSARPVEKLELRERMRGKICAQGLFAYEGEYDSPAQAMQYAALSYRDAGAICRGPLDFSSCVEFDSGEERGVYLIIDLGSECAGFLDLDLEVDRECVIDVGYGEHLSDGRCRTAIRGFSCRYYAAAGKNQYMNTFRRFGCRYIQLFCHTPKIKISYAGIRPTVYPVKPKALGSGDLLRDTVYDVCVNTLVQCMHEHYEDCPWREQALYTMDSRNQMLCGYYAFGEYRFPRACLELIARGGLREDGILSLCYPAGSDLPIPCFSLMYFVQCYEYVKYSGDLSFASEYFGVLERIADTFISKLQPEGYIHNFYGKDAGGEYYWNFYEWSPTMDGRYRSDTPFVEAPINAFFSIGMQHFAKICRALGKDNDADKYEEIAKGVNSAIAKYFYDPETGLFESFLERCGGEYSVLTNSLCLLCGAAEEVDKSVILKVLAVNGAADTGLCVYPNTLSMNSFRFDALLREDREKYKKMILDEIDRDYLYMLREGATAFWETIVGEADFGGAGSLCHGWSALPVYYYETLLGE